MALNTIPLNPFDATERPSRAGCAMTSTRRDFIKTLAGLSLVLANVPEPVLAERRREVDAAQDDITKRDPWLTLAAVYAHMLPSGDAAPGAEDIHAIDYLYQTLTNPGADSEDTDFIINGVGWLQELAQSDFQRPFIALVEPERERLLRRIETSGAGERWLSLLLTYLLEALLADPAYGSNKGEAGWRWLEHQPGFPRPPADKVWYRLGRPVHFQRKA